MKKKHKALLFMWFGAVMSSQSGAIIGAIPAHYSYLESLLIFWPAHLMSVLFFIVTAICFYQVAEKIIGDKGV